MTEIVFDSLEEGIDYFMEVLNTSSPVWGANVGSARHYVTKQFGRDVVEAAIDARIKIDAH